MINLSEENKQIIEQFKNRVEKSRKNSDNHENLKFFNTEPDENNIINKNNILKNRLIVPSIKSFELQNQKNNNDIIIIQKENKSTQNLKNNIMKKNKDETNKINKKNSKNINNINPK